MDSRAATPHSLGIDYWSFMHRALSLPLGESTYGSEDASYPIRLESGEKERGGFTYETALKELRDNLHLAYLTMRRNDRCTAEDAAFLDNAMLEIRSVNSAVALIRHMETVRPKLVRLGL